MRRVVTIIAVVMLFPASSFAQLPTAGEAMGKDDSAAHAQKGPQIIDFGEGENIDGVLVKPLVEDIVSGQHNRTGSLIRTRSNFIPELLKSVENI